MPNYHVVIKRFLQFSALSIIAADCRAGEAAPATQPWDTYADTWVATDGLGRKLPTFDDVGAPKANKNVAMFYYMWLDGRDGVARDMAKQLEKEPQFRAPIGQWWWWGEPVLGYYQNADPFVNRVHASELSDAGIDALFFDSTNSYTHEPQYLALCDTYSQMRAAGLRTPSIAHVTHAKSGETVQKLYDDFYSKGLYRDLWYEWNGKPIVLTDPAKLTPQLADFFTVRESWAWHDPKHWFADGHDKWPWIDIFPQQYSWHDSPETPEQISVSAAQHPSSSIGRSFTYAAGKEPSIGERQPALGTYFAEQWTQAQKVSPEMIFVTNWNEWIAKSYADDHPHGQPRKFIDHAMQAGEGFFVDEYDPEFSRDIEPAMPTAANRGVDDNYYYQLVANIRRYKGVRPLADVTATPITVDGDFADWKAATPEYRDTIGDPAERDFAGYDKDTHYVNHTGRNDIIASKVTYDAKNVYFYVRTKALLSPDTGDDWMLLYLDTDHDPSTGWMGYDFVINRSARHGGTATLERNVGGKYNWQPVNENIKYATAGNEMELAIPIASLGGKLPATIDFKWADHCYARGDWTDFTLNGDAAPNARFNYRAKLIPSAGQ